MAFASGQPAAATVLTLAVDCLFHPLHAVLDDALMVVYGLTTHVSAEQGSETDAAARRALDPFFIAALDRLLVRLAMSQGDEELKVSLGDAFLALRGALGRDFNAALHASLLACSGSSYLHQLQHPQHQHQQHPQQHPQHQQHQHHGHHHHPSQHQHQHQHAQVPLGATGADRSGNFLNHGATSAASMGDGKPGLGPAQGSSNGGGVVLATLAQLCEQGGAEQSASALLFAFASAADADNAHADPLVASILALILALSEVTFPQSPLVRTACLSAATQWAGWFEGEGNALGDEILPALVRLAATSVYAAGAQLRAVLEEHIAKAREGAAVAAASSPSVSSLAAGSLGLGHAGSILSSLSSTDPTRVAAVGTLVPSGSSPSSLSGGSAAIGAAGIAALPLGSAGLAATGTCASAAVSGASMASAHAASGISASASLPSSGQLLQSPPLQSPPLSPGVSGAGGSASALIPTVIMTPPPAVVGDLLALRRLAAACLLALVHANAETLAPLASFVFEAVALERGPVPLARILAIAGGGSGRTAIRACGNECVDDYEACALAREDAIAAAVALAVNLEDQRLGQSLAVEVIGSDRKSVV